MALNDSQNQAENIANIIVNQAGANFASVVFNTELEGETFAAMRQKAMELLIKLDLIANSINISGVAAMSISRGNQNFKQQLPYNQKDKNNIASRQVGDPNEDPETTVTQYVVPEDSEPQKTTKAIRHFITGDGKEKNPDENFLVAQEILDSVADYDHRVNSYVSFTERMKGMYARTSEYVDSYDRVDILPSLTEGDSHK